MHNENVSSADIHNALRGVSYPATKDDLIDQAKKNRADENVIACLKDLPEEEYGGPQDVTKAYGETPEA